MKAYICVYRHPIPIPQARHLTELAAANNPPLRQFLDLYDNQNCFYDWGMIPASSRQAKCLEMCTRPHGEFADPMSETIWRLETTSCSFVPNRLVDQLGNTFILASEPSLLASPAKSFGLMITIQGTGTFSTYWHVQTATNLSSMRRFTSTTTTGRSVAKRLTGYSLAKRHASTLSIRSTLQPGPRGMLRSGAHHKTRKLLAWKQSCFRSQPPHVAFVLPTPRDHTQR